MESVLRSRGDTSVTYFAPDHGFSRPIAHCSVSPPTLSKTTSNLNQKKAISLKEILLVAKETTGHNLNHQNNSYFAIISSCSGASSAV